MHLLSAPPCLVVSAFVDAQVTVLLPRVICVMLCFLLQHTTEGMLAKSLEGFSEPAAYCFGLQHSAEAAAKFTYNCSMVISLQHSRM